MGHHKPATVAGDVAQALWGRIGFAQRASGGKLAPKDYHNHGVVARKELSLHKAGLMIG